MKLLKSGFEELLSSGIDLTIPLNLIDRSQISIHLKVRHLRISPPLHCTSGINALSNLPRVFFWIDAQDLWYKQWDFDLKSKTGTHDLFEWLPIASDLFSRTNTLPRRITGKPAGTRLYCRLQNELSWKECISLVKWNRSRTCFHCLSKRGE
jgi:hypothetical protein